MKRFANGEGYLTYPTFSEKFRVNKQFLFLGFNTEEEEDEEVPRRKCWFKVY